MDRKADGACLVHQRTLDGLTDPPGCIGRETEAFFRVELLHGTDETQVTFFDEIQQREATARKIGFNAYGEVRDMPDPVSQALDSLLDTLTNVVGILVTSA